MTDLNSLCYQAIAFKDIDSLNYLVQVCDQLHNGKEEVDGFKQEELPSDERYEEMKRILKQNTRTVLLGIQTEDVSVINRKYIREKRKIESNNVNTLSVNRGTKPISQNLLIVDGIQIEETVSGNKRVFNFLQY